jgi:transposase
VKEVATWVAGVDLGRKGAHLAVLADESGQQIGPALSFFTSPDDLDRMRAEFKARAPEGTEFVFVMEPTPTWRPVARYLKAYGHRVFLANQAQTKSLRNLLKRHAKTDRLDALTLAKLPLVSPQAVRPAPVPDDPRWEVLLRGVKREYKLFPENQGAVTLAETLYCPP